MKYLYDLIILGGGPVGLVSSKIAASLGKRVAIVEKERLGGSCTLTGCVPTKTLIAVANYIHYAQDLTRFKCTFSSSGLDTGKILEHVRTVVEELYAGHSPEIMRQKGISVVFGEASFIDQHTIDVSGKKLSARTYIIGTGSFPFIPAIEGINDVPYLTNENLFNLEKLPSSLIILGGGPIGTELGSCLQRLGTQVTIVEQCDRVLPREDNELVQLLSEHLTQNGVLLKTNHTAYKIRQDHSGITLACKDKEGNSVNISGEKILIAIGRCPNIEPLKLENTGVSYGRNGIIVNDKLQTTMPHIYAAGDVVGPYLFSHMAAYQATIATKNALFPFFKEKINYNQAIWVTFCDPELASLGLTEEEARAQYGNAITVYKESYAHADRPRIDGRGQGMIKLICDKKGYLIGAHIYGARAGELIAELQIGKYFNLKLSSLYKVIHPYPTYSGIIFNVAKKAYIDSLERNWLIRLLRSIQNWWY